MPKTNFVEGLTVLTADWANHVQDHVHDGMDEDGHAPKIHLYDGSNFRSVDADEGPSNDLQIDFSAF